MSKLEPISLKDDTKGLVWSSMVTDTLLAELQTSIMPNLLHLVIFDTAADHVEVWNKVGTYNLGDSFDADAQAQVEAEIADALVELGA